MPIALQLVAIKFGVQAAWESEEAAENGDRPASVMLAFEDVQSGIQVQVPFDGDAWVNFQRHVEKNGLVPAIELARGMPTGGPAGGI